MLLVYDVHVHVYSGTSIIRTLSFGPVVSTLEGFHCKCFFKLNVHCKYLSYFLRRIDRPHNKTALVAIQAEMHEHEVVCMYIIILHCFLYGIGVLATYRKSLSRKQRDSVATTQKRLMHSRHQQVSVYVKRSLISICIYNVWCLSSFNTSQKYDRRNCQVMGSEQEV